MGRLVTRTSIVAGGGGGTLVDGASATITTASGFGTNTGVVQAFVGGINGPIETTATGTNIVSGSVLGSGWAYPAGDPQYISNGRAFNGTKSIHNRYGYPSDTGGSYNPGTNTSIWGFRFDPGASWLRAYTRVITYKTTGSGTGQVKFQRFTGALTGTITGNSGGISDDNLPNVLLNNYTTSPGPGAQAQCNNNTPLGGTGTNEPNIDFSTNPSWVNDGWVQQEYDFVPGTVDTANGSIGWRFRNASTFSSLGSGTASSKRFWQATDPAYRYWVVQHLIANEAQVDGAELNIDRDFYGAFNTSNANFPKCVLLGDASTYAACTKLVIQKWSSWADGSITFTANKGCLTSLTGVYAYVLTGIDTVFNSNGLVPS